MARIAIVSSFVSPHIGGVESFVDWMRGALREGGHEVRLISCAAPDAVADLTLPSLFLGSLRFPLPYRGFGRLRRELRGADLVIAHSHRHLLALLTPYLGQTRPLFFVHTTDAGEGGRLYRTLGTILDAIATRALRRARLVALSHSSVGWIESRFKLSAIYFPYPTAVPIAEPRTTTIPGAEGPKIVWVGRLAPEKNPLLAVSAVEALRSHLPEAQLHLYGDGPLRTRLAERAAARLWLHLHGARPHAEVIEAQRRSTICLASSIADNVQVAALEALASGLPFVGTAVGELPRYFRGELGRFCVQPTADALAEAMLALLDRYEDTRERFGANAEALGAEHGRGAERLLALVKRELEASRAIEVPADEGGGESDQR